MKLQKQRKRPSPVSIRLNEKQRALLRREAGSVPLSSYVKQALFAGGASLPRRSARTVLTPDRELAGRVLAALGASRIASNLSQIAKHANLGTLYFDEGTKADIREACEHLRDIRALLMAALGKEPRHSHSHQLLTRIFNRPSPRSDDLASAFAEAAEPAPHGRERVGSQP
jgi:hypothetical protein